MGPSKSKIGKQDVRLGLRYAWHEEPDKTIINIYMVVALGTLSLFAQGWAFLVLTLTFLAPFLFSLGYQAYRGLAAARDARDFSAYIDEQARTAWRDPWLTMPADFDDPE
jgi:hypothetical protein